MEKIRTSRLLAFFAAFVMVIGSSCKKDDDIPKENSRTYIYDIFQENYFWLEHLPKLDPNNYQSNEALIDALVYSQLDRWSFVAPLDLYISLFEQGETKGFGVGMAVTPDNRLMVRFTYKNSPMGLAGGERGWEIIRINNIPMAQIADWGAAFDTDAQVKFTFRTINGETVERTMARTDYAINTVLHRSVIETAGKKVGYLVFESFLEPSKMELEEAFSFFKTANVNDIVVDLRYNGGGSLEPAFLLSVLLGGTAVKNKIIASIVYNSKRTQKNGSYGYPAHASALNLNRLFFITTESSASASEMVINSMFPYKEVILIGSKTYGKPVGMEVHKSEEYDIALAPVTMKLLNANDEGDYFNGIPVNYQVADDVFRAWGDPAEACLKTALDIISGNPPAAALKSIQLQPEGLPLKRGLQEITGAY